jgi:hypothetical protein
MTRAGLNAKNWAGKDGAALRTAARGHGKTPEHPERAARNPQKYAGYMQTRNDLMRRAIVKKDRLFGDTLKFNQQRSNANVLMNPRTDRPADSRFLSRFLKMSDAEIMRINWTGEPEWGFLFYH